MLMYVSTAAFKSHKRVFTRKPSKHALTSKCPTNNSLHRESHYDIHLLFLYCASELNLQAIYYNIYKSNMS